MGFFYILFNFNFNFYDFYDFLDIIRIFVMLLAHANSVKSKLNFYYVHDVFEQKMMKLRLLKWTWTWRLTKVYKSSFLILDFPFLSSVYSTNSIKSFKISSYLPPISITMIENVFSGSVLAVNINLYFNVYKYFATC